MAAVSKALTSPGQVSESSGTYRIRSRGFHSPPPVGVTDPGCLLAPMRARTGLHMSSVHPTPDSHSVWWAEGAQQTPLGLLALLHVLNFAL